MISIILRGDFRFFYPENIIDFANFPSAWDASLNTGIGKSALGSLWINSYLNFTATFTKFGLSWEAIGLIFWILPSIILSFFSAYHLFKTLFPDSKRFGFLAGFVYITNTYFLMIFLGGQLGVALAYSLAPLVFLGFVRVIRDCKLRNSIVVGIILALQILFDPRLTFMTLLAVGLYWLFFRRNIIFVFLIPSLLAVLLHSYWVLPLLLTKLSPIPADFDSLAAFEFFSFADFSHALSLLHPNWPENIFGKVYFLQPEFLLLPIIAYSSLLFINLNLKSQNSKLQLKSQILYFSLLGLMGAFLAKGINPPFREINIWLFQNVPGMFVFRDPTKWYILIALSYSILIPFSILKFSQRFNDLNHFKRVKISNVLFSLFLVYSIILIKPIAEKNYIRNVPEEYKELKDFLVSQPKFFRTLWIPEWQRYGFFSNNHPAVGRFELFKQASASGQIRELINEGAQTKLQDLGIKYIIVPYDSEREIFLEDRKYNNNQYLKTIGELKQIEWLKEIDCSIVSLLHCYDNKPFGKIAVFEVSNPKDHFFLKSGIRNPAEGEAHLWRQESGIEYKMVNPTKYLVDIKNAQIGERVVFSEVYDKYWQANIHNSSFIIPNSKYNRRFNSFILPKEGDYSFEVYYTPQKWVNSGLVISLITLVSLTFSLFLIYYRK